MCKLVVKIYGVESRRTCIDSIVEKLSIPEDCIFIDDRPNGGDVMYTAKKAWLSDHGDATHALILQDDIEVCDGFLDICKTIIDTHPDKIVSLFPFQFLRKDERLNNISTPYVATFGLSGQGIIMPVEYIKPCFDYIKIVYNDDVADDTGIASWAFSTRTDIITTIPAILQHIGDISALDENRPIRRTVYYDPNPVADWTNEEIDTSFRHYPDFSPKGPNVIRV